MESTQCRTSPDFLQSGPKRYALVPSRIATAANVIEHFSQTEGRNWVRRKSTKLWMSAVTMRATKKISVGAPVEWVSLKCVVPAQAVTFVEAKTPASASIALNTPRRVLDESVPAQKLRIKISVAPITI